MIGLFKEKSIVAFFALVICTVLIHLHIFNSPIAIAANANTGVLNLLLQQFATKLQPVIVSIFFIVILFVQSVRLTTILNNNKMYAKVGFTPAFAYIFLSGLLPNAYLLSPAFIANSFIVLLFGLVMKLYNNPNAKGLLFNVGFLTSVTIICYYPSVVLVLLALCGLAILRPFRIAEWFILLLGIVAPFYLLFAVLYLCNFNFQHIILNKISFFIKFQHNDVWYFVNLISIAVLMIAAFISWYPNSNRLVIQIRKNWVVMLILLVATLATIPIYTKLGAMPELITLMPMAAFLANFFVYPRSAFFSNLLIFLTAIIIVYNNSLIWK